MTGHDTPTEYVIRLPDRFWQKIVDLKYMHRDDDPATCETFMNAQKARYGSGYVRYITGDHRTLGNILAQLHVLIREIRSGECRALGSFGIGVGYIDRVAHQRIQLASEVNIIPLPDEPEANEVTENQGKKQPVARYIVAPSSEFFWLERHSIAGEVLPISPYTDPGIARGVADYLNTLVRWEAPES